MPKNRKFLYEKAGHKLLATSGLLNYPFDAGITIEWKDGRYRVTLSSVVFHTGKDFGEVFLSEMLTKKGTEWRTGARAKQIGSYTEEYYASLFSVKPNDNW